MTSGRWAVSGGFPEPTALSPSCSKGLGCGLALLPTGSRPPARDRAHFHVRLPRVCVAREGRVGPWQSPTIEGREPGANGDASALGETEGGRGWGGGRPPDVPPEGAGGFGVAAAEGGCAAESRMAGPGRRGRRRGLEPSLRGHPPLAVKAAPCGRSGCVC